MWRLQGMASPNGAGPPAGGTESPAQSLVAAKGALVGDGSDTDVDGVFGRHDGGGSHCLASSNARRLRPG